jgi:hypothetical protein
MAEKMSAKEEIQTTAAADYSSGSVEAIGESDWTAEEETAIRRRFDFTITPLVTVLYMLCAIDR